MSDTPRTDAAMHRFAQLNQQGTALDMWGIECVDASFAHDLERENAALERENAALRERMQTAEAALTRRGYRKRCDIPACNCGDQWGHGGHAEDRLREFSDELRKHVDMNGKTLLIGLRELAARAEAQKEEER